MKWEWKSFLSADAKNRACTCIGQRTAFPGAISSWSWTGLLTGSSSLMHIRPLQVFGPAALPKVDARAL